MDMHTKAMASCSVTPTSKEFPHILNLSNEEVKEVKFVYDPNCISVIALEDVEEVVTETDLSQYGFVKIGKYKWKNKRYLKEGD